MGYHGGVALNSGVVMDRQETRACRTCGRPMEEKQSRPVYDPPVFQLGQAEVYDQRQRGWERVYRCPEGHEEREYIPLPQISSLIGSPSSSSGRGLPEWSGNVVAGSMPRAR